MDGWEVRLHREHDELVARCASLVEFGKTDDAARLSGRHRALLDLQRFVMLFYLDVLGRRMNDLEEDHDGK